MSTANPLGKYQPYPEYKDSGVEWLGDVPNEWSVIAIKRLSRVKRGASPRPIDDPKYFDDQGTYSWVRISDVTASDVYLYTTEQTLSALGSSLSVKLHPGDLFLSIAATVGKPCIAAIDCCIHDGFVFFPDLKINTKFLYYLFSAGEAYKGLGKMGTQLNLNTDTVGDIKIGIGTNVEIENIVAFLDYETARIDQLIAKQQQLIELLKEKRQAVISHAVTKGLNPNAPMKDSGVEWLGQVPEHWRVSPLKYECSFSGGGTPSKENLEYWNGSIPWVSPKDMKSFWITDSEDKITEQAIKESSTNLVKPGAVLMVVRSGILQRTIPVGINTIPVTINQDMKAIRCSSAVYAEFLTLFIKGYENSLLLDWRKQGATVESIEHEYLANALIPFPPEEEAIDIITMLGRRLKKFDLMELRASDAISILQERRTALISAAVTGKIDLRGWQAPKSEVAA